jgi:Tfp pilus tip-associated adhesin PilY1
MSDSGDVGNTLIVMDLASGVPLKVFGHTGIDNEIVASPTPVLDGNGYIRYIYVPDLSGNLYRFDLQTVGTKNTGLTEWTFHKVFQPTSGGQPAFHRAEAGAVTDGLRYVFFGTGNQEFPISDNNSGKFYAIRDADTDNTTILEASLTDITSNINSNAGFTGAISSGWKLVLGSIGSTSGVDTASHAGEKVLSDPVVFNGVVYFTTYAANSSSPCTSGGTSRLYGLGYQTGGAGLAPVTGETPVGLNTMVSRHVYTTLGVASSPTLSINPSGSSSIFVGFSGVAGGAGTVKEIQVQSPPKYKTIKSWKEIL